MAGPKTIELTRSEANRAFRKKKSSKKHSRRSRHDKAHSSSDSEADSQPQPSSSSRHREKIPKPKGTGSQGSLKKGDVKRALGMSENMYQEIKECIRVAFVRSKLAQGKADDELTSWTNKSMSKKHVAFQFMRREFPILKRAQNQWALQWFFQVRNKNYNKIKKSHIIRRNEPETFQEKKSHEMQLARLRQAKELFSVLEHWDDPVEDVDDVVKILEARDRSKKKRNKAAAVNKPSRKTKRKPKQHTVHSETTTSDENDTLEDHDTVDPTSSRHQQLQPPPAPHKVKRRPAAPGSSIVSSKIPHLRNGMPYRGADTASVNTFDQLEQAQILKKVAQAGKRALARERAQRFAAGEPDSENDESDGEESDDESNTDDPANTATDYKDAGSDGNEAESEGDLAESADDEDDSAAELYSSPIKARHAASRTSKNQQVNPNRSTSLGSTTSLASRDARKRRALLIEISDDDQASTLPKDLIEGGESGHVESLPSVYEDETQVNAPTLTPSPTQRPRIVGRSGPRRLAPPRFTPEPLTSPQGAGLPVYGDNEIAPDVYYDPELEDFLAAQGPEVATAAPELRPERTFDKYGFDEDGVDRDGFDTTGFNKAGYLRSGLHWSEMPVALVQILYNRAQGRKADGLRPRPFTEFSKFYLDSFEELFAGHVHRLGSAEAATEFLIKNVDETLAAMKRWVAIIDPNPGSFPKFTDSQPQKGPSKSQTANGRQKPTPPTPTVEIRQVKRAPGDSVPTTTLPVRKKRPHDTETSAPKPAKKKHTSGREKPAPPPSVLASENTGSVASKPISVSSRFTPARRLVTSFSPATPADSPTVAHSSRDKHPRSLPIGGGQQRRLPRPPDAGRGDDSRPMAPPPPRKVPAMMHGALPALSTASSRPVEKASGTMRPGDATAVQRGGISEVKGGLADASADTRFINTPKTQPAAPRGSGFMPAWANTTPSDLDVRARKGKNQLQPVGEYSDKIQVRMLSPADAQFSDRIEVRAAGTEQPQKTGRAARKNAGGSKHPAKGKPGVKSSKPGAAKAKAKRLKGEHRANEIMANATEDSF